MRALTIIFGILLLLPGVCSIITMFTLLPNTHIANDDWPIFLIWAVCVGISVGGLMMIRSALRK